MEENDNNDNISLNTFEARFSHWEDYQKLGKEFLNFFIF